MLRSAWDWIQDKTNKLVDEVNQVTREIEYENKVNRIDTEIAEVLSNNFQTETNLNEVSPSVAPTPYYDTEVPIYTSSIFIDPEDISRAYVLGEGNPGEIEPTFKAAFEGITNEMRRYTQSAYDWLSTKTKKLMYDLHRHDDGQSNLELLLNSLDNATYFSSLFPNSLQPVVQNVVTVVDVTYSIQRKLQFSRTTVIFENNKDDLLSINNLNNFSFTPEAEYFIAKMQYPSIPRHFANITYLQFKNMCNEVCSEYTLTACEQNKEVVKYGYAKVFADADIKDAYRRLSIFDRIAQDNKVQLLIEEFNQTAKVGYQRKLGS